MASKQHSEHLDLCRDIVTGWVGPHVAGDVLKLKMAQEYIDLFEQYEHQEEYLSGILDTTERYQAEAKSLKEQLETIVEATRFKAGEDCWCAFRQVDDPDWHSPQCERVREILGISSTAPRL